MLRLNVNGQERVVAEELDPATPLLWVLRDNLGLVGTKYGCGAGFCGACTVQLDGVPVRSCLIAAATVDGKQILTIEGLGGVGCAFASAAAGLDRARCPTVRLLPSGAVDVGGCAAAGQAQSQRYRYRCRDERQFLPLWYLSAHPGGDSSSRAIAAAAGRASDRRACRELSGAVEGLPWTRQSRWWQLVRRAMCWRDRPLRLRKRPIRTIVRFRGCDWCRFRAGSFSNAPAWPVAD